MNSISTEQLFDGLLRKNGLKSKSTIDTFYQKKLVDSIHNLIENVKWNGILSVEDVNKDNLFEIMLSLFENGFSSGKVIVSFAFLIEVMKKDEKFYDMCIIAIKHQIFPIVNANGGWVRFLLILTVFNSIFRTTLS